MHVFGIAYKRDVNDMRESPALDILEVMKRRGAEVTYTDPFVPELRHGTLDLRSIPEADAATDKDCAVIVTDHSQFNYRSMVDRFPLIVDTRNALKGEVSAKLFRL